MPDALTEPGGAVSPPRIPSREQVLGDLFPPDVLLALSILSHRSWCRDCRPHAVGVRRALAGESVERIVGGA